MALFKCKMCGGDLNVEGNTIVECEYCGTKQTVPKVMDENLQNVYNRANALRIKSEFDKAEKLYEKIIQVDDTQSEAYWGLILCKYGIEYVDDPLTLKKVPTCHRASYDSIIADADYKLAIENADISQRVIYEEQAKEIDRIQKDILDLARKEDKYDVFICYKETDNNGNRTIDSVIANDIYYQLTREGFRVFYSAITLEGKLGSAYEPIIFAALNSAKVMLAIGTKPEYFNAIWVKNEWSRFLKIIKKDRSKALIPCYRDMDAYELPDDFAHLQAQDMSKIGFINDLVRGIGKIVKKDEQKPVASSKETVVQQAFTNVTPLLRRAFLFLEDKDWDSADEYCEKVLDLDPENAQAYLGKLMAELNVRIQDELKDCDKPFDDNGNYQKALRFANDSLKHKLIECIECINDRNEKAYQKAELERKEHIYQNALKIIQKHTCTPDQYIEARVLFESIKDYKDSSELGKVCWEKAELARKEEIYLRAKGIIIKRQTEESYKEAARLFSSIFDYKDSNELAKECLEKAKRIRNFKIKIWSIISVVTIVTTFCLVLLVNVIKRIKYEEEIELFEKNLKIKLQNSWIGDEIEFGRYEQNNINTLKEEIMWIVIKKNTDRVLLISKFAIESKPYNLISKEKVYWANSSIRDWLNNDFLNDAFYDYEKKMIIDTGRDHENYYSTEKIFLLDSKEANLYFSNNITKECAITDYAKKNYFFPGECTHWWLRDPNYKSKNEVAFVTSSGDISTMNQNARLGIRPAMWVYL